MAGKSRQARQLAQAGTERRRRIEASYAARHPERARELRALRKEQAELARPRKAKSALDLVDGTPETRAKAGRTRQGALARLYQSGALSADQLAWALEIAAVAERIGADVAIGTVSLETRVDQSGRFGEAVFEKLGTVRREVAYTAWRASLGIGTAEAAAVLAMIREDCGVKEAMRRYRIGQRRLIKLLGDAIDLWPDMLGRSRDRVDPATLAAAQAAAQAGLLS